MSLRITLIALCIVVLACSDDAALRKSIFIQDADNPGLPVYSEWGYNTFGAYYNRKVFVSNDIDVPLQVKYSASDDATTFTFTGDVSYDYTWNRNALSVKLIVHGFRPAAYADLISLHQKIFSLTDPSVELRLEYEGAPIDAQFLSGNFEFKRVQHLFVDNESTQVILSGVFDFQAVIEGEDVTMSLGRFDIGVSDYNFFRVQ